MGALVIVGLVSCSAQKLDRAAPARELYCSALFRLSLAYATARADAVYVLSAKYGLVELDQVLAPYDLKLDALSAAGRRAWGARVAAELERRHGRRTVIALAGATYVHALRLHGVDVIEPLAGMQIGQRLAFLSRAVARATCTHPRAELAWCVPAWSCPDCGALYQVRGKAP